MERTHRHALRVGTAHSSVSRVQQPRQDLTAQFQFGRFDVVGCVFQQIAHHHTLQRLQDRTGLVASCTGERTEIPRRVALPLCKAFHAHTHTRPNLNLRSQTHAQDQTQSTLPQHFLPPSLSLTFAAHMRSLWSRHTANTYVSCPSGWTSRDSAVSDASPVPLKSCRTDECCVCACVFTHSAVSDARSICWHLLLSSVLVQMRFDNLAGGGHATLLL